MDASTFTLPFVGACIGKEPFSSPQTASKVLRRWRKARRSGVGTAHVYKCPSCGAFHIGNRPKPRHNSQASRRRARRRERDESMV